MSRIYHVYLMTNFTNTVIYIGVTNNLMRRVFEHKHKANPYSFSAQYNLKKLVYYEEFDDIGYAIAREKQLKGGSRRKKELLIAIENPGYADLSQDWYD